MKTIFYSASAVASIAGLILVLSGGPALAASTSTWIGASGSDWGTSGNWSGTDKPPGAADTALFNSNISSVTNTSNHSITSISFDTGAGSITIGSTSGGQLDVASGGTIQTLSTLAGSGLTETINAPIVIGSGSSAATYTFGDNAAVSSGDALSFGGAISGGTTGGVTLTLNGSNTGAVNTISGAISNGSASSISLSLAGAATWSLTGNNSSMTGGTISVTPTATLLIGNNNALGTDAVNFSVVTGKISYFGAIGNITISNSFTGNPTSGEAFIGAGNLTINGSWTTNLLTNPSLYNLATGTLTFGGAFNLSPSSSAAQYFEMKGIGNTTFNSTSSINNSSVGGTATGNFIDMGSGTITISGNYAATGQFYKEGGALVLDTSSAGTRLPNNALSLGGVTLDLSGSGGGNQTVSGVTFHPGQSTIQEINAATTLIKLGAITGSTGGLVNFGTGAATTSSTNSHGILGAAYVFNGTDWAVGNTATTAISGYNAYTTFTAVTGASNNYLLTGSGSIGASTAITQNTLKISSATGSPQSLSLGSGASYTTSGGGGLLYVGSDAYSITGGTLNNNTGQFIVQQWGTGTLTINSIITDPSSGVAGAFVKGGTGTLVLGGANTFTAPTYITDGTVSIGSDQNLGGQNAVTVASASTSSPTVTLAATAPSDLVVGASFLGSTIASVSGTTVTLNGNANQNIGTNTSVGFITSTSNLTLVMNGGVLSANSTFSLAETIGSQTVNRSILLQANGGTLDVTSGNTLTVAGVIGNRSNTDLAVGTFTPLGALTKTGTGTLVLGGLNTYSGGTQINGGVLNLGVAQGTSSGPLGASSSGLPVSTDLITFGGGTLQYSAANQTDYSSVFSSAANQAYNIDTNGQTVTFASALISNGGKLTKLGGGTLILSGVGNNTYSGLTTVSAGELDLDKTAGINAITGSGGLNIASPDVLVNGGTLKWLASNQVADNATISVTTGGTVNLNGFSDTIGDFSNSGGTFTTGAGKLKGTGASVTWSGGTNTINAGGVVEDQHVVVTGGANTVQGAFSGPGAVGGVLQVDSGGTGLEMTGANLTLNSDPTSAGELLLQGGANVTTHASSTTSTISTDSIFSDPGFVDLGAGTSTFTVASGTTSSGIDLNISAPIQDGALTKAGAGTLALTNSAGNTYTGGTTVTGGTLFANSTGSGASSTGSGAVNVSSGGTLSGTGAIRPTVSSGTAITVASGGNLTPGGVQPAPVYTPNPTNVANGSLLIDSTGVSSGHLLSVAASMTLSSPELTFALGSGGTSSKVVVGGSAANTINFNAAGGGAGSSVVSINDLVGGSLNLDTAYVLIQGNTQTVFEDNGAQWSLSGGTGLTAYSGAPINNLGSDTLFQITGGLSLLTGANAPGNVFANYYNSSILIYDATDDSIDVEVVPEPGTWAMMLGGLAALVFWQRRKRND